MRNPVRRTYRKSMLPFAAVALVVMVTQTPVIGSENGEGDRLGRKVRVMERVLDEVLVQSPNVYVSAGRTARGLVLDEFGALFTAEGSLGGGFIFSDSGEIRHLIRTDDSDQAPDKEDPKPGTRIPGIKMLLQQGDERSEEERLKGLREELSDALIDYGITLSELRDNQWLAVAIFLDGRTTFSNNSGQRLILKVKMGDLRRHASGQLSREAAVAAVKIEER